MEPLLTLFPSIKKVRKTMNGEQGTEIQEKGLLEI
jgi:hypothetical protein